MSHHAQSGASHPSNISYLVHGWRGHSCKPLAWRSNAHCHCKLRRHQHSLRVVRCPDIIYPLIHNFSMATFLAHTHTHTHTQPHTRKHTHTHTHTHTPTHTHIHTHTHTHTQASTHSHTHRQAHTH